MNQRIPVFAGILLERVKTLPVAAQKELFLALDAIERRYGVQYKVTEDEAAAIDEALNGIRRGEPGIPIEEVAKRLGLGSFDANAYGKETLAEAVEQAKKLPGEEQGVIADVIFALLPEQD